MSLSQHWFFTITEDNIKIAFDLHSVVCLVPHTYTLILSSGSAVVLRKHTFEKLLEDLHAFGSFPSVATYPSPTNPPIKPPK